jgi:hypothetical protein
MARKTQISLAPGREKSAKIFMPLLSSSSTATAAKPLFTLFALNDSAAEFYVNSAVAERFFAPLWEQFAQARGRRECRELSDREWFVLGVRRVLTPQASGRAFLQQLLANGWAAPK